MAAFRHRSHSTLSRLMRRLSCAYFLQVGLLILILQSVFEVLQIRTWHRNQINHQTNQANLQTNQAILQNSQRPIQSHQHHQNNYGKMFVTSLHWNNEAILPQWSAELLKLINILGRENVYISIFESGSWDSSKSLLRNLDEKLGGMDVTRNVTLGEVTHEESVKQRPGKEEGWVKT